MIVEELGKFSLSKVTDLTFIGIRDEFASIEKDREQLFHKRLDDGEDGVRFADMALIDTLGERPVAIISMWTDRINRQVVAYVVKSRIGH